MGFYAESSGDFERCPPGMHLARCYSIIDLGTQKTEYMGAVKFLHKVRFNWEIHGNDDDNKPILMKDNRPFSVKKDYTLSWGDKANLRLDLQSWRGKPFSQEEMRRFDLKNVLGVWCMLNVFERPAKTGDKIYTNVDSVSPVPSIIKKNGYPDPHNETVIFNLKEFDLEVFNKFHDYLKQKIMLSPEYQKLNTVDRDAEEELNRQPQAPDFVDEDDIPFN